MPWARLEDGYFTHRKVADLSKDAKLLDLAAIAFSARELRDGELTRADVRIVAAQVDVDDTFAVADQLVTAGRWGKSEGGYVIHDYLKYNPSREQVLKEREAGAKRLAEWRRKKKTQPERNGVTAEGTQPVPDPVPEPGPGIGIPDPVPVPESEPDDARPPRESSESKNGRVHHGDGGTPRTSIALIADKNGAVHAEPVVFSEDVAFRIQEIGRELGDDNVASSITRAQRVQAAAHLEIGVMANAIKDAHRSTLRRINDHSRAPPEAPMAYFLTTLQQKAQERAGTT